MPIFLKLVILILIVLIGILAYWVYGVLTEKAGASADNANTQTESTATAKTPNESLLGSVSGEAEQLALKYVEASGGRVTWMGTHTIRSSGTIETPKGSWRYELFQRHPNSFRLNIYLNDGVYIATGFNGKDGWREYRKESLVLKRETFDESMKNDFENNVHFYTPVMQYIFERLQQGSHVKLPRALSLGEPVEFDGQPYQTLVLRKDGEPDRHFYIDPETYLLRGVRYQSINGEVLVLYSNYKQVQSRWIPFLETYFVNGEQTNVMRIDDIQFNSGLLSDIFNDPAKR